MFKYNLPHEDSVEKFAECIFNEDIFYNRIYIPPLALKQKSLFESNKCEYKIKSKGVVCDICCDDVDASEESMDAMIDGLLQTKRKHVATQNR